MRARWISLLVIVAVLGGGFWIWMQRSPAQIGLINRTLPDGSPVTVITPPGAPKARVLLALPADRPVADADLQALSLETGAQIVRFEVAAAPDCAVLRDRLLQARAELGGEPTLIAGIGDGAALVWRTLAGQKRDDLQGLAVGLSLAEPDCPEPLPPAVVHGRMAVAWNDNPDEETARFIRQAGNVATSIAQYGTPLPQVMVERLGHLLSGAGEEIPVVEVPATDRSEHADTVTLFYSGDGGWRDLDRDSASYMAQQGYPVVGIDTLRYFWKHRSPEQAAADLSRLMAEYRSKWGAKRFVLAGYSFGADILPALYNRLPAADQEQVSALLLLALARTGSFEIEVAGWLGKQGDEAATGPELARVPAQKIVCIYGSEETDESGCTQPGASGEMIELPGGHHFDEDYNKLAGYLMRAIDRRAAGR